VAHAVTALHAEFEASPVTMVRDKAADAVGNTPFHTPLADFGADKRPEYADFPTGRNPILGVRGLRLLLQRDGILGPQVRALAHMAKRRALRSHSARGGSRS
jgi:phosphoenolpyruvate-protein kinase (PTS system EI component)